MTKIPHPPQLQGLIDLACHKGVDVRSTLLRVLTDLYVQKPAHAPDEEAQYIELALPLIGSADAVTRTTVAARLASYPAAPSAVLEQLARVTGYTVTAPARAEKREPEVKRPETEHDLTELFFKSSQEERRLILANFDVAIPARRTASPVNHATTHKLLEAAALTRNKAEFAHILRRALGVSESLAGRIVDDASGEPLIVAVKALAMPTALLQRVLLFLDQSIGQSVERVYDLANLYEELNIPTAEAMLDIWRNKASMPRHQSVYHQDERRGAREAMIPSNARTTRRSSSLASRFRNSGR
ncbi:MAG: hypothetical protein JO205_02805 [Pseudolabrys sp.]|nr:hypothetical protein [Pseudolabrys sp.]MBV9260281.1 hypothetical protein [Pseudolabrys sp.]